MRFLLCSIPAGRMTSKSCLGRRERDGETVADREVDYLLVGGGMASAHCAAELRRQGAEGRSFWLGGSQSLPMNVRR